MDSNPEVVLFRSHAEGRSVLSCCLRCLKIRNFMHELHVAGSVHDEGWGSGAHHAGQLVSETVALPCRCDHTHRTSRHASETTTTTTTGCLSQVCPLFCCVTCDCEMRPSGQPTSAAQRRGGRRLRAALRHERQSIAMALAEF